MKIFYHVDADGKCAGFLVKSMVQVQKDEKVGYYKINYGMEFPFDLIEQNERVFIVDFSISPEEMTKLLEITQRVVWIDHHISAIEKYKNFDREIAGVRIDGFAGCILTWWYFYRLHDLNDFKEKPGFGFSEKATTEDILSLWQKIPMYIRFIGDYDVWKFEYGIRTKQFYSGLELFDNEPYDAIWECLEHDENIYQIIKRGQTVIQYRSNMMREYCKTKGFETVFDGYKSFAINMANISSDDFIIDNLDDYDLLIGFSYNGDTWSYSLRSTKVDCSKLAMKYGGGGHKGAAGFNSDELLLHHSSG